MCLYTRLIKNPKYKANKKNNGLIPPVTDQRVLYVPIGCGRCMECRKQKANSWQTRLQEDIKSHRNGKFITLTFSNENIAHLAKHCGQLTGYELDNAIATLAVRRFLERWRKQYKKSLRHWLVTELGHNGTENIHLHGIVWTDEELQQIKHHWKYGFVWPTDEEYIHTYVNAQTVNYIVKYIYKIDAKHKHYNSRILTSAGIGANYPKSINSNRNKYNGTNTIETYKTRNGRNTALPIYWRNKIYTDSERERLWLHRLDRNERWIGGEKVKADDAESTLKKLLWYRAINKKLGYGSYIKNETEQQNELELRYLQQQRRILRGLGIREEVIISQYRPSARSNSRPGLMSGRTVTQMNSGLQEAKLYINETIVKKF